METSIVKSFPDEGETEIAGNPCSVMDEITSSKIGSCLCKRQYQCID